ncbi:hypothetical protein QWM81_22695 [Streptomyces ficellus]|uniref:Uncharacterized protein n=1 Tax=Streptomyces ficellus TaxID=1977088 RepID=A0ABT7ZBC0_9ACTN|nr:hypothetical protein [Streptomyces ficellus]MDN3296803.1 hypothetical protein [Streptomyces ficellus]
MISQRTRLVSLIALPVALSLAAAGASPAAAEGTAYQIDLDQLNDSGGNGTVMLSLDGRRLTVKIEIDSPPSRSTRTSIMPGCG